MPEPFLKWPGGKRWLVSKHSALFPPKFDRYIEPFLGGGAVFFHLKPGRAILADTNAELINAYVCIQKFPESIERGLALLQRKHSKSVYYHLRKTLPVDPIQKAVRFIYLNRTCFNGIYRVNLNGEFNVPMGTKNRISYEAGYLSAVSSALRSASFHIGDFEQTISRAGSCDLIFADPPYTVMHNNNNFVKYNASLFSWVDQMRLAASLKEAARRGASIVLSNADHPSVRELYRGFGYHFRTNRNTVLAADSDFRRKTTELLITNFEMKDLCGARQLVSPHPAVSTVPVQLQA